MSTSAVFVFMDLVTNSYQLCTPVEWIRQVGFNEATVLYQIHCWTEHNKAKGINYYDGQYWTYNSMDEWAKIFFWWSRATVKRIFAELESKGYLLTANYNKRGLDRTKWYAVNYHRLKMTQSLAQNDPMDWLNLTQAIPKTNHKQTTKTNDKEVKASESRTQESYDKLVAEYGQEETDQAIETVNNYLDVWYGEATGHEHKSEGKPKRIIFAEKLLKCAKELNLYVDTLDYALHFAIEHYDSSIDPTIYYVTKENVLGYWLVKSGLDYAEIMYTNYDTNDETRGIM